MSAAKPVTAGSDPYKEKIDVSISYVRSWTNQAFSQPGTIPAPVEGVYIRSVRNAVQFNRNVYNMPLTLGDKQYSRGLYMDTPAAVKVVLNKPAQEFIADIGIDNNPDTRQSSDRASARFHVSIDDKDLYLSPVIRLSDKITHIQIPLKGAKEFMISVDDADDGISWDQCVWGDAAVKLQDGTVKYLDDLRITLPAPSRRLSVPFSFKYDGRSSDEFLDKWEFSTRELNNKDGKLRINTYTDPETGLSIECEIKSWNDCAIADWVFRITNTGTKDSGLIENFLPLDCADLLNDVYSTPINLRWSNGDKTSFDSFLPHDEVLEPGKQRYYHGPLSSNQVSPFFNIQGSDGGWILAVGWTGAWKAEFDRDSAGRVTVRSGMEKGHFRLKPGETVRTPSMVLLRWDGKEMIDGHNQFRRAVLSHYVQMIDGKPAEPPVAYNGCGSIYEIAKENNTPLGKLTEKGELEMIDLISSLGCEAYWMDAYWYPQPWSSNLGNWYPRPEDFPRGLLPLADAAHGKGMKFVLWMLPPAVNDGTVFDKEYPQYLHPNMNGYRLWKMGDPEAREFLTKWVCGKMNEWKVDIYREDGSGLPADEGPDDRIGIAEMKHIDGLYKFWSDVVDKSNASLMDNCCGGGNRIDIETSRRSFYLWRSDFDDIIEGLKGRNYWPVMGRNDQVMIGGLNLYMPFHTGPVWDSTPYSFRSDMSPGIVLYGDITRKGYNYDFARKGIDELKELRPFFQGDYYPLMNLTTDQKDWYAYQFDRPDMGKGCAMFFRRVDSAILAYEFNLQNIDPDAIYRISLTGETYRKGPWKKVTGIQLMKLAVKIPEKPGSALLRYEKL